MVEQIVRTEGDNEFTVTTERGSSQPVGPMRKSLEFCPCTIRLCRVGQDKTGRAVRQCFGAGEPAVRLLSSRIYVCTSERWLDRSSRLGVASACQYLRRCCSVRFSRVQLKCEEGRSCLRGGCVGVGLSRSTYNRLGTGERALASVQSSTGCKRRPVHSAMSSRV
jgi:hypothetical protein